MKVTPVLRTSGLLQALAAEDVKLLFFVLSFLTNNGDCHPTDVELAGAMQISIPAVRTHMASLLSVTWLGKPLLYRLEREDGCDTYALTPGVLVRYEQTPERSAEAPVVPSGNREAVIAYSRSHYATPRAEVERQIAVQMGWEEVEDADTPEAAERRTLYQRLLVVGIGKAEATALLDKYSAGIIAQQLDWLPYRYAKSPPRYLVAAIEGNYRAPRRVGEHEEQGAQEESHETVQVSETPQVSDTLSDFA